MSAAKKPHFKLGKVYRTHELARWSANPTRMAKRLMGEGKLRQAAQGLFYKPRISRFGPVPATETAIMRAFLEHTPFLISGPRCWNQLGLGSTALFATPLVYNTKRTGEFTFDGRKFLLRRVRFPKSPSLEWFVIDLLQHHDMAGTSLSDMEKALTKTLCAERWDATRLWDMAREYGTKATQTLVKRCLETAGAHA